MNRSFWCLLIAVSVLTTACSRKVTAPILTEPKPVLNIDEFDFDYFQGKAKMVLRDANKEREVKAHIRIRKDSVIWMSINVVGVQAAKALINRDSITVVSNLDKEYYVFEYAELSKRYNFEINYDVIQSAMLGNLLTPRNDSDKVEKESSMYILRQHAGTVDVINFVNAASMKLEKVEMKETNTNNSLVINYSNFQAVGNELFPYNGAISLYYKAAAGVLNTTIIFEYSKAELDDKNQKLTFNIPRKYVRR